MFSDCKALTTFDLNSFDTSNVTDMSSMFRQCEALTTFDVSGFDTSNVTDMEYMFYDCAALTILDLSSFDTSNVTDMSYMFSWCEALTTIYASDKFVTDNVKTRNSIFSGCYNLTGGAGTVYSNSNYSLEYARIDGGTEAPGYFTKK